MEPTLEIILRPTSVADLETLFEFQTDLEAIYNAAFTPKDPTDKSAYIEKFSKLLLNPAVNNKTILLGERIVGSIAKFEIEGEAEITYWIDKKYWGRGIATFALKNFLLSEIMRPISGRVAFDNLASQKVLENCGFIKTGEDKGFANARQMEIKEYIYQLTL